MNVEKYKSWTYKKNVEESIRSYTEIPACTLSHLVSFDLTMYPLIESPLSSLISPIHEIFL